MNWSIPSYLVGKLTFRMIHVHIAGAAATAKKWRGLINIHESWLYYHAGPEAAILDWYRHWDEGMSVRLSANKLGESGSMLPQKNLAL